jgi:hypothetical protein
MTTSSNPDTLTAIASVVKTSLPPGKPPETDETKPAPWQASQLVAQSDDLDEIPFG